MDDDKIDYESPALPRLDPAHDPLWQEDQEQLKAERDHDEQFHEGDGD